MLRDATYDEQVHWLTSPQHPHTVCTCLWQAPAKAYIMEWQCCTGELGFELATYVYGQYCVVREITNTMDTDTKLLLREKVDRL